MHFNYNIFDCHCDTLTLKNVTHTKSHLKKRDIEKFEHFIQVFAICNENKGCAYSHAVHFIKRYVRLTRLWHLAPIKCREELARAKYGSILALEGADALRGNLHSLRHFYNMGVRLITLTWNNNNAAGFSITDEKNRGLTDFGKSLIEKCEEYGIAVDLSHLSDRGFFDACEISKKPLICSHSNSRAVNGKYLRNITNEQFEHIKKSCGVVGINFCTDFIGGDGDIEACLNHIEHFCALGGEKNIGMGSDFDGIPNMPKGCNGADFFYEIACALLKRNYSEAVVKDIMYGNFYRVFYDVLGV